MKKPGPVAIIGAGISGLSCGQFLKAAGIDVRIFESASTVGGRCATQLWQGHLVDVGVQYFTAQTNDFKRELLTRLRQFRPIISPVINHEGKVVPSSVGPRFYVLQGNNYLAQVLSRGLDLRLQTSVETLSFSSGIHCLGETYRAVVSSLPGPQAARLFNLSHSPADYEPCLTAMLEYSGANLGISRECYARFRAEDQGAIVSSYCENHKAGRIIGDKTVFVVNTSAQFSRKFSDEPCETYLPLLARENEELWQIPAGLASASSSHRWVYARPRDGHRRRVEVPCGAFICGDSRTDSTVENVWLDGRAAAGEVISYLAGLPA